MNNDWYYILVMDGSGMMIGMEEDPVHLLVTRYLVSDDGETREHSQRESNRQKRKEAEKFQL